jgi:MFS family permease
LDLRNEDVKDILRNMSFTSSPIVRSRWADVSIASSAQFLGALGTFLVMVTQVLALQQRGATGLEVAALVICEAVPMVVLGKPIGWIVDRVDSRVLLVVAGAGQVLSCLALAYASEFAAVIGGVLALSVASAVSVPTRQALIPAMVARDDLPRASAIGQSAGSAGMMLGPALAGFLVGGVGPQQAVRFAAVGFLATIVAGLTIRTRRGERASAGEPARSPDSVTGWSLQQDPLLRSSVWGLTAVVAAAGAVNVVLVFFVMGTLQSSAQMYGVIDAMWTVGMLAGAWLFGVLVKPRTSDASLARRLILTAGFLSVAVVAVGTAPSAWWIVPWYLVGGAQNGGLNVLGGTLMGRRVPADARGRANAALGMRVQAGALIGYVAGGLVLQLAEPRWVVIGCGILGMATAAVVLPLVAGSARILSSSVEPSEVELVA